MKKILFIAAMCIAFANCKQEEKPQATTSVEKQPIVAEQLIDFTQSTANGITYFDSTIARELYLSLAYRGNAIIKVVGVYANSANKEVFTLNVAGLDTIVPDTKNIYQLHKILQENEQIKARFMQEANEHIAEYIKATTLPHDNKFSDVASAFSIAQTDLQQQSFQNYQKVLLVFSDLWNQPANKKSKLRPIDVNGATVICLRPILSRDSLTKLFQNAAGLHIVTSTKDITTIIHSL